MQTRPAAVDTENDENGHGTATRVRGGRARQDRKIDDNLAKDIRFALILLIAAPAGAP
jgi:hypothetical protein